MSPIIYTPHDCNTPEGLHRAGTLWQCDICDATWSAYSPNIGGGWRKIDEPRQDQCLVEARQRINVRPTTPTVTSDLVQLALDTYWKHSELGRDDGGAYAPCVECGTGSYDFHTIMEHAREKALEAVQNALRGETHGTE